MGNSLQTPPQKTYHIKSYRLVLEALQHLNHATAQDILDAIRLKHPAHKVSLTSVYRALGGLVSDTTVKPVHFNDGQVRYELNHPGAHHHHFICTQCQAVREVTGCPFEGLLTPLQAEGFLVHYHTFELFGLCPACQGHARTEAKAT